MNSAPRINTSGIIAALDFEARSAQPLIRRGWRLWVSGMGPEKARDAAHHMFAAGISRVLVWGTAGGLDPLLKPGTLFLPDAVLDARSGVCHEVSGPLHAQLAQVLARLDLPLVRRGLLVTTAQPLVTAAEKAQAAQATGAAMVDMETAAIADAAAGAGAQFAALRVLLDAADASLPPAVITAMNTAHPHLGVVLGLAKRPQDLPAVLHLGQAFRHAHQNLLAAARVLADAHA